MIQPSTVELLIFRIGAHRYGADVVQITRIDRPSIQSQIIPELGAPLKGDRALVVQDGADERELRIDQVEGLRTVPLEHLRRLPPAASAPVGVLGLWLEDGERPVVLLDLLLTLDSPSLTPPGARC